MDNINALRRSNIRIVAVTHGLVELRKTLRNQFHYWFIKISWTIWAFAPTDWTCSNTEMTHTEINIPSSFIDTVYLCPWSAARAFVETVAVMSKYNPFFEKAGMKRIAKSVPDKSLVRAVERLRTLGFNPVLLASEKNNLLRLQRMSEEEVIECRRALLSISSGYYKRLKGAHKAYVKKGEFKEFVENATLECLAKVLRKLAILTQTIKPRFTSTSNPPNQIQSIVSFLSFYIS